MINTFAHIEKNASLKKRGISALVMLIVSALFFYWSISSETVGNMTFILSLVWLSVSILLLLPLAGEKIYFCFTVVGGVISFIILNTVMLLFFYLFFTPLGLILRLLGKNQVSLKVSPGLTSNWHNHQQTKELKQYLKQY